jgi:hypothetical protein
MGYIHFESHDSIALQDACSAIQALEVAKAATGSPQHSLIHSDAHDDHEPLVTGFHVGGRNRPCGDEFL